MHPANGSKMSSGLNHSLNQVHIQQKGENLLRRLIIVITALFIVACTAGSGEGLDASGRPAGEGPPPGDEPTLANIQARIFTPICTRCHVGAAAPQGLRLDEANAYDICDIQGKMCF